MTPAEQALLEKRLPSHVVVERGDKLVPLSDRLNDIEHTQRLLIIGMVVVLVLHAPAVEQLGPFLGTLLKALGI